jgi:hypothetical protein
VTGGVELLGGLGVGVLVQELVERGEGDCPSGWIDAVLTGIAAR